jgi:hypothetical protein
VVACIGEASRQPEVGEVAVSSLVDEDVRRLDVAVHESALMGGIESVGDGLQELQCSFRLECALLSQQTLEISALDEAHGDVELSCDFAGVVDRDDRRVIERRGEP